ncbi:Fc.00g071640.m01.CDS01 [Cosmosporella sp. VM-42]
MRPSTYVYTFAFNIIAAPITTLADAPPYVNDRAYDNAKYGGYPTQKYKSSNAIAPRPNIIQHSSACDDGLLTFLSPRGYYDEAKNPRAVILNSHGAVIWSSGWEDKKIYNLMTQKYKGEDYITFWAGNDAVGGHGAGQYYMLDRTYNLTHKIGAANGLDGDLHEFRITEQGTAMMTVYQVVDHDLTSLGKTVGPIWDCLIQEIDIETGELVFEWRAGDHINVSDTYRGIGGEGEPHGAAFDWFHINSIDKDLDGNYIISSRYLHTVTKIDGKTGDVIWVLGGKSNMFEDLSHGKATDFAYQHDAHWTNNYSEITLFDNSDDGSDPGNSHPRGLRIRIDEKAMTVKLLTEYENPEKFTAASQGSMQDLESGNVIVGFGYSGVFTEFDHNGKVICDTHFGPQEQFGSGGVQSYRVYKFPWKGMPATDPALVVAQDDKDIWRAYFSWNGATEVAEWVLQGAHKPSGTEEYPWRALARSPREGLEMSIALQAGYPSNLRVVALDQMGNILGMTDAVDASMANVTYTAVDSNEDDPSFSSRTPTWALAAGVGCGALAIGIGIRPAFRALRKWRAARELGKYRLLPGHEK